jgi:hypothetical protein
MTDYRRMVWQYWANRIAVSAMGVCIILWAPEVLWALKYHFPWWDDVLGLITVVVFAIAGFVKRYTMMYRFDL